MTPIFIRLAGLLILCGSSDLFISLCNAAMKHRFAGKPLPILGRNKFRVYRPVVPLLIGE